jgi:hypothetical protein
VGRPRHFSMRASTSISKAVCTSVFISGVHLR